MRFLVPVLKSRACSSSARQGGQFKGLLTVFVKIWFNAVGLNVVLGVIGLYVYSFT